MSFAYVYSGLAYTMYIVQGGFQNLYTVDGCVVSFSQGGGLNDG